MKFNNKVILEIDSGKIKIIEGSYFRNVLNIKKAISIDINSNMYKDGTIDNPYDLSYELSEVLNENKISAKSCYMVINSTKIITRNITLPTMSEEDMTSLLKYKIEEYMPIKKEDYIVNHIVLNTSYNNMNVMLICAPRDMIKSHKEFILSLKLKPKVLDYQGNTISKLLKHNHMINDLYKISKINIAAIEIAYESIRINIIESGDLMFSRFTEFKSAISILDNDSIIETIEATFKYYQSKNQGNIINLILLHGDNEILDSMEQNLSGYFEIPAIKLNQLDNLDFHDNLWEFADCIGALIRR